MPFLYLGIKGTVVDHALDFVDRVHRRGVVSASHPLTYLRERKVRPFRLDGVEYDLPWEDYPPCARRSLYFGHRDAGKAFQQLDGYLCHAAVAGKLNRSSGVWAVFAHPCDADSPERVEMQGDDLANRRDLNETRLRLL